MHTSNALESICRWASSERPQRELEEEDPLGLGYRASVRSCALGRKWISEEGQYHSLIASLNSIDAESLRLKISQLRGQFGDEASIAIRRLHQTLAELVERERGDELSTLSSLLSSAADRLREEYESSLDLSFAQPTRTPAPLRTLSEAQRRIGSLILDRLLGSADGEELLWICHEGNWGIFVRALMSERLSLRDRIYLSAIVLDGLSSLHDQRLEPNEGFDPDLMSLSSRFEVFIPKGEPTAELPLLSPERQAGEAGGTTSDVWALGQLLLTLYTARPLGQVSLSDHVELEMIPAEVKRVLERFLHPDPAERLYSAKEVRVVMNGPMTRWLDRLSYEDRQQESDEAEALPYEEATAQQEERDEVRAKRRRLRELSLRRALQWRASKRQMTAVVILGLIFSVVYGKYSLDKARAESARSERVAQAIRYAEAFDLEDSGYQAGIPPALRQLGFSWRLISGDAEVPPHLISTTEVTHAQYQTCVDADACEPLIPQEGCVWGVDGHESDPINCLTFYQARAFAQFAGGDLPTVEQWMWSATRDGAYEFPWGNEAISTHHANLDFESHRWERGVRPVGHSIW